MSTETNPPQTPPPDGHGTEQAEAAKTASAEAEATRTQTPKMGGTTTPEPPLPKKVSLVLGLVFWGGIAVVFAWKYWGPETLWKYSVYIGIGVAAIAGLAATPGIRRWLKQGNAARRIGAILALSILCTLAFIVVVFLFEPDVQAAFLRLVFIMVVCSLPAVMYYLFIATKKYNLYNEFMMNLDRLGLLDPAHLEPGLRFTGPKVETAPERRQRILTYKQKFESVYGKFPTNVGAFVIDPTDKAAAEEAADDKDDGSLSSVFTFDTTLPVLLATLLIALGWLITLPPWDGKLNLFGRTQTERLTTAVETQTNNAAPDPAQPAQTQPAPQQTAASAQQEAGRAQKADRWFGVFSPVQSPVRFAFIGAYFFALQLLFRRYVRRDLRASAYVNISMRIILAVVGIWVVSAVMQIAPSKWTANSEGGRAAADNTLLVAGFAIGVFPRVAWQVVQAALKRGASIFLPSLKTQLPVSDLDGLTVWHEARFEEEDIENIPNMATADIVDLMINTRLPPDRIIDWVDQAILYTHLGPEKKKKNEVTQTRREILQAHGIRTASVLVETYGSSELHGDREEFEKILPGDGRNYIRSLVDAVGTNPNLRLVQTWRGLHPHTHGDKKGATPLPHSKTPGVAADGGEAKPGGNGQAVGARAGNGGKGAHAGGAEEGAPDAAVSGRTRTDSGPDGL